MDRPSNKNIDSEGDAPEPFARFHKLSIVSAVWKHRYFASVLWLGFSLGAFAIVRMLPSIYAGQALVLVDSQKIPETFVNSTVGGELADRLTLISEHIMSSPHLLTAVRTFDLYRDDRNSLTPEALVGRMRKDVSVSFEKSWTGGRMQAFRLTYQAPDPQTAANVANWLAEQYVEENARARRDQAAGTVDFLSHQLQDAKTGLNEQENKVAHFKQEHNGSLPEQESSLLATLNSLNVELQGTQASIDRAQESRLSLDAALSAAESSDSSLRAELGATMPGLATTSANGATVLPSVALEEKLQTMRLRYTPEHPEVQALEAELKAARRAEAKAQAAIAHNNDQLATTGDKAKGAAQSSSLLLSPALLQSRERMAILRSQLDVAKRQIESAENQRVRTIAEIAECQNRIHRLPLVVQEMTALNRNYEQSAATYNSLLQKRLAAGIATDMERLQKSEQFAIVDPARAPHSPIKPKRLLLNAAGIVAGLLLSLLLTIALEIRRQTFVGEWELPSDVTILGRVPLMVESKLRRA